MIRIVVPALLATGCVVEQKVVEADLSCSGVPLPDMAPDPVRVDGIVKNLQGDHTIAGVAIQPFSGMLTLTPLTSASDGTFHYMHDSGNVPNNDFVEAHKDGFLDTQSFPSGPVVGQTEIEVRMVTMDDLMRFGGQLEPPLDITKGIVFVRVADCNLSPLAGGTVTSTPAGSVNYFRLTQPSAETDTDASGIAMLFNLPPGEKVTLSGSLGGMTMRSHELTPTPGAFVITELQP